MQEQTTPSGDSQQLSVNDVTHQFYEAGREILSKPNLLCDIVESLGTYPVIIYCNTPSDTDFVEVMLRKRGINSQKLIGNVPQEKIDSTFDLIAKSQLSAVVVTDIAARLIDKAPFQIAINYSSPQDSDIYLERCTQGKNVATKKILTLVSPLELANFHFIKKALHIEPEAGPVPSPENIAKARYQNLRNQALQAEISNQENISATAALVANDEEKEKIISYLLHNTLNVLPSLKSAGQSKNENMDEDEDFDDRPRDSRQDRWNNNQRSGGRSNRQDRGDNYRSRDSRDRYDSGRDNRDSKNDSSDDDYNDSSDYQNDGQRQERRQRHNKPERRAPLKKDARIYLSTGSDEGVSKENILELLGKHGLSADSLKHVSIRKNYAFFDIEDDKSNDVIEGLKNDASNKTAIKAITINAVSEEEPESAPQQDTGSDTSENESEIFSDNEADNIGNR